MAKPEKIVGALVVLLPFVVLWWTVPFAGETSVGMDYVMFPTAHQQELMFSVDHGTWPLYVPGFAGGRPAAALTLGQLYHPISHLASRIPGYWTGHAIEINTLLRLLSLGLTQLALLFLLRRWGFDPAVAFLLSFVTVYNMRMLDTFRFGAALENYTGHLLLCAAIGMSYLRPTRFLGPASIVGSAYLLTVGGHPQMFYLGLLGAAVFTLLMPLVTAAVRDEDRPAWATLARFYGRSAAWSLAGLLLASAYTVPFYFDYVLETPGRAEMGYEWSLLNTDSWGGELNSFFRPLHVSIPGAFGGSSIILLAGLVPLCRLVRRRLPWTVLLTWGSALVVLAVALGKATPLHYLFWKYVPLADAFRVPGRVTIILPVLLLLLLAWLFADARGRPVHRTAVTAGAALALFGLYQIWLRDLVPPPAYPVPAQLRELPGTVAARISWVGAAVLAAAAAYGAWPRARRQTGTLLALLVVLQTGMVLGHGTWKARTPATPTASRMAADRTGSLLFRGNPGNQTQSGLVDRKMRESTIDGPLARFYRRYLVVRDEDEAFAAMASDRSADEVVVEGFEPGAAVVPAPPAAGAEDRVVLEEATFNRLRFAVDSPAGGFLSLNLLDRYRWGARVDGERVATYRANGGERAVYLPAGRHRVEFRYWSPAAFAGVLVSLATLCAIGLWVVLCLPRERGRLRVVLLVCFLLAPAGLFAWWKHSLHHGPSLGTRFAWDSSQAPDARNLAYGRKTEMSSLGNKYLPYGHYAGRGVDGDRETTGFSTAPEQAPWWQVDLGASRVLDEVRVYRAMHGVRGRPVLNLLLSGDGRRFDRVATIDLRRAPRPWSVTLGGRPARFVRVQQDGPGRLALNEVEVYGPPR